MKPEFNRKNKLIKKVLAARWVPVANKESLERLVSSVSRAPPSLPLPWRGAVLCIRRSCGAQRRALPSYL